MGPVLDDADAIHGSLKVSLISSDIHLLDACREALRELALGRYDIALLGSSPNPLTAFRPADLGHGLHCSNTRIDHRPPRKRGRQELCSLVNRKRLHEFLTNMPFGAGSTLLKPVNKEERCKFFLEPGFTSSLPSDRIITPFQPPWSRGNR